MRSLIKKMRLDERRVLTGVNNEAYRYLLSMTYSKEFAKGRLGMKKGLILIGSGLQTQFAHVLR